MEHLIPPAWIASQPQWALLAIGIVALATVIVGADRLVEGASGIAYRLGISPVIVGATVVSLGTTSPECAVSVMAAWSGDPGLALGNAIGSIIADTGLIFGLGCMMAVLPADRFVLQRQGWVQFGSGALLAVMAYGALALRGDVALLGRSVGVLLLGLLVVYLWVSVRWSREHRHGEPFQMDDDVAVDRKAHVGLGRLVGFALVGLGLVLLGSRVLILSVTELAEVHWRVPHVVIAATLVALGTSTPELIIGLAAVVKGQREILVGNVIGADILNVLFVVGASAVAAPLPLVETGTGSPRILFWVHLPTMLLILLLFRVFIARSTESGHFRRWYGVPLVLIYVAYTLVQYLVA